MLAFLSNRATAAHLALGAVAPLVLCKYFGAGALLAALLWISLVAAVWAFMAPAKGEEERSSEARRRFFEDALGDPFFWVALLLIGYAALVALNGGVALEYDLEQSVWRLITPTLPQLPGGVTGAGGLHFASAVIVLVIYPAVAYALDARQSVCFALFAVTIVTVDAVFAHASGVGISGERAAAYGLWSLVAASVLFSAERTCSRPKELIASIMLAGCLAALLFSGRPALAFIFVSALVLMTLLFVVFAFPGLRFQGAVRAIVLILVSGFIAAMLYKWRVGDWMALIPNWSTAADGTMTRLATEAWESAPWVGVGLGGFPLAAKLGASPEDWAVIGAIPDFYANGWRALLVERGMIGVLAVAVSVGTIGFAWLCRARRRGREFFTAPLLLFPLALAAVAVGMVFDGSTLQADAFVAFASLAALSVNGGI